MTGKAGKWDRTLVGEQNPHPATSTSNISANRCAGSACCAAVFHGCLMADIPVSAIVASGVKILDEESPMKQVIR